MDDPTITEIWAADHITMTEEEDRETDPVEREQKKIEFREDIQNASLKRFDDPNYYVMTFNMSGKTKKGYASSQRTLISIITRNFFPSVIFCQELPDRFKEEVVEKCGTQGFDFVVNEKEAAVMWITKKFDGERLNDRALAKITEGLQKKRSDVDTSQVRTRTSMVLLSAKDAKGSNSPSFLAVSWHGPKNKVPVDGRKRAYQGLICFLQEICKQLQKKGKLVRNVIIGGDFNLNTLEDLDPVNGEVLGGYELSCRGMEASGNYIPYKDNFVFFNYPPPYDGSIRVSRLRVFEFENSVYPGNDITENDQNEVDTLVARDERKDLLDHDPIIGVLQFFHVMTTAVTEAARERLHSVSLREKENLSEFNKFLEQSEEENKALEEHTRQLNVNIKRSGLKMRRKIPKDGNCLFHAIADQLTRLGDTGYSHSGLRQLAVETLRNRLTEDEFRQFFTGNVNEYLKKMSNNGEWGDYYVIWALAHALQKRIKVVTSSNSDRYECAVGPEGQSELLLGLISQLHFVSLEPKKQGTKDEEEEEEEEEEEDEEEEEEEEI